MLASEFRASIAGQVTLNKWIDTKIETLKWEFFVIIYLYITIGNGSFKWFHTFIVTWHILDYLYDIIYIRMDIISLLRLNLEGRDSIVIGESVNIDLSHRKAIS